MLLAAVAASGCGPFSHDETDARWLVEDTGRAVRALPAASAPRPFRVAVYGDVHRGREGHRAVVSAIRDERPDLVVFTGDALDCRPAGHMPEFGPGGLLIPFWPQYYRGRPLFTLLSLVPFPAAVHELLLSGPYPVRHADGLNSFLEDTAPLRLDDAVPFLFVPGNHDVFHEFDRREIARLFGEPGGEGGRDPEALWFSLDAGGVRFVVLDTGSDTPGDRDPLREGGPQWAFLEERVAGARREGLGVVVCAHLPPFATGRDDPPRDEVTVRLGEVLRDTGGIALVLSGHTHQYERLGLPRRDGTTACFVVTSGGGAEEKAAAADPVPESVRRIDGRLHFVLLEIDAEEIRGRFVAVRAPGRDGPPAAASFRAHPDPQDTFTIPLPGNPGRPR